MSRKIQIIYFEGCPNFEPAKNDIIDAGIEDFELVKQDDLPEDSDYKRFSSPSILVNNEVVFGSKTDTSSCSVGKFNVEILNEKLATLSD